MELRLGPSDEVDLDRLVRATPAGVARRARCIQLLAQGETYAAVRATLDVTDRFIARVEATLSPGRCVGVGR